MVWYPSQHDFKPRWPQDPAFQNRIMMTSSNWNLFRVTGLLWGEFTGHRWIPLAKASEAGLWCFLWSAPEQTVEQTFETPVILDATALIMTSQIYTVAIMKSTVTMKVFAKNYPLNMSETSPGYNHQYSGGGCWGWWVVGGGHYGLCTFRHPTTGVST